MVDNSSGSLITAPLYLFLFRESKPAIQKIESFFTKLTYPPSLKGHPPKQKINHPFVSPLHLVSLSLNRLVKLLIYIFE